MDPRVREDDGGFCDQYCANLAMGYFNGRLILRPLSVLEFPRAPR